MTLADTLMADQRITDVTVQEDGSWVAISGTFRGAPFLYRQSLPENPPQIVALLEAETERGVLVPVEPVEESA